MNFFPPFTPLPHSFFPVHSNDSAWTAQHLQKTHLSGTFMLLLAVRRGRPLTRSWETLMLNFTLGGIAMLYQTGHFSFQGDRMRWSLHISPAQYKRAPSVLLSWPPTRLGGNKTGAWKAKGYYTPRSQRQGHCRPHRVTGEVTNVSQEAERRAKSRPWDRNFHGQGKAGQGRWNRLGLANLNDSVGFGA